MARRRLTWIRANPASPSPMRPAGSGLSSPTSVQPHPLLPFPGEAPLPEPPSPPRPPSAPPPPLLLPVPPSAPPLLLPVPPSTPPSPPGGGLGDTDVESVTVHPLPAAATLNMSGCPVKPIPPPAVIDTTHRPDVAIAVTVEVPSGASGASNTTWRACPLPGTP
ncbi:MAG TPA: hypothetical protein VIJ22_18790 [Polyangiaceae bacterium]